MQRAWLASAERGGSGSQVQLVDAALQRTSSLRHGVLQRLGGREIAAIVGPWAVRSWNGHLVDGIVSSAALWLSRGPSTAGLHVVWARAELGIKNSGRWCNPLVDAGLRLGEQRCSDCTSLVRSRCAPQPNGDIQEPPCPIERTDACLAPCVSCLVHFPHTHPSGGAIPSKTWEWISIWFPLVGPFWAAFKP